MNTGENVFSGAIDNTLPDRSRQRVLHRLGIFCGFAAALWLAGAEAPTKLVTAAVSPMVISFMMVFGAFISRWSLPALIRGTADTFRRRPACAAPGVVGRHGRLPLGRRQHADDFCGQDIGSSLAFPLWNSNSLIGISVGHAAVQGIASGRWDSQGGRSRRRSRYFRRGDTNIGGIHVWGGAWKRAARHCGRVGRGTDVRVHVHPISKGLHHRHESAHVPYLFHVWRDDDDDRAGARIYWAASDRSGTS